MKIIRVGVDLAKNVFHVHGVDRKEEAVWRRKLSREKWLKMVMEKLESGGRGWNGGVRGFISLGTPARGGWFSGEADGAAVCEAVREER